MFKLIINYLRKKKANKELEQPYYNPEEEFLFENTSHTDRVVLERTYYKEE